MQLADTDDLALWYALNRLMTNYRADVDGNSGSQAHEFYPKSGSWMIARWHRIGGNQRDGDRNDGSGSSPEG
jgi:hypothetical protein